MTLKKYYIGGMGPYLFDDDDFIDDADGDFAGETRKGFITDGEIKSSGSSFENLTASRMLSADANKKLVSIDDLTAWITGTIDQIIVTDNGDGTITLSTSNNFVPSDISGTVKQITVTDNGDGTITLSTPQDIDIEADVKFGSVETSYKSSDGSSGMTTTFINGDGATVTVKDGIITDVS